MEPERGKINDGKKMKLQWTPGGKGTRVSEGRDHGTVGYGWRKPEGHVSRRIQMPQEALRAYFTAALKDSILYFIQVFISVINN